MPTDPIVLPELRDLLPKPTKEERAALRQSLKDEGQRDDIIVWLRPDNSRVIVEGHTRFELLKDLGVKPRFADREFKDIDEVKEFMYSNALARRNLSPEWRLYIIGKEYLQLKKRPGGQMGQHDPAKPKERTSAAIARRANVSEKTVRRAAKLAKAVDEKSKGNATKRAEILNRKKTKTKKRGFDGKAFKAAFGALTRGVDNYAASVGIKGTNDHKALGRLLDGFWKEWERVVVKVSNEAKEKKAELVPA